AWIMIVSLAWAEPARLAPLGWRRHAVDQRRSKAPHQYAWHSRKDHQQSRVQEWVLGQGQRDPAGVDPVGKQRPDRNHRARTNERQTDRLQDFAAAAHASGGSARRAPSRLRPEAK